MLKIKTKLDKSMIHGLGLFADEDVPKGTVVWEYNPATCHTYTIEGFIERCKSCSLEEIKNLINYSYIKNKLVYSITDDTRYINHSTRANVDFSNPKKEIALRDIKKGEEILENYFLSYDRNDFFETVIVSELRDQEEAIKELEYLYVNSKNFSFAI